MTFRVFSGWDSRQEDAAEVFAYSVREQASVPVEITFLQLECLPINRGGVTSFTYGRFLVPWLCGYQGVALFADGCDQLCLGDVAELAVLSMDGHAVRVVRHQVPGQPRPRVWTSFMLLDCAAFHAWTPEFVQTASDNELMRFGGLLDSVIGDLPEAWNTLVQPGNEPPEGAKLAHWSALSDPEIGDWIDASGSRVWREWRERWRAA